MQASILQLLTLFALCFAVAPAGAQPKADDTARTHFEQGKQLAASGKYADAYREFAAGYGATPRPAFLFNMGEAARGMGDVAKAREAYKQFLAAEPTGPVADTARKRLAELGVDAANPATAPAPASVPTPREAAEQHASASSVVAQRPAAREDRPLWKKWPLWAAVGGAVVTGIVIAAVSTDRNTEPACGEGCIDLR